jgi:hypothetical protein
VALERALGLARDLQEAGTPEAEASLLDALREQIGRLTYYRLPPGSKSRRTRSAAGACAAWLAHVAPKPRGRPRSPAERKARWSVAVPCRITPEARAALEELPRSERGAWLSAVILATPRK